MIIKRKLIKLYGAVDESSADQKIPKSDVTVNNL